MTKNDILSFLPAACPWRDSVLWFDSIDSTNTRAKSLAVAGAPHGTVLIADYQIGGRGSRGRRFHSPAGSGVYLSVILRPVCDPGALMHLTCAAATAMCDAVEAVCGFRPGVKWINDLVFHNRKLAGILTELGLHASGVVDYAVIGIGMNCCQRPEDFPEDIRHMAGSLSSLSGRAVDRNRVAAAMVEALWKMDSRLLTEKAQILSQYRRDCVTIGREVSVVKADGAVRHGRAVDIDAEGALVVEFAPGQIETVCAGEVSVRGMYGYV